VCSVARARVYGLVRISDLQHGTSMNSDVHTCAMLELAEVAQAYLGDASCTSPASASVPHNMALRQPIAVATPQGEDQSKSTLAVMCEDERKCR
jgi:hypothetical protein